jgi:hypothetical protein
VGFPNVRALVDAEAVACQSRYTYFRKVPAVVTVAGSWYDYSMAPGNPTPQYYAASPLTAQTLSRSADGGIQHGGNTAPESKYLRNMTAMVQAAAGVPQRLYLLDYLLFYPFCDMGTPDPQTMTNVQTIPRYPTGEGVEMMAVLVAPHGFAGDTFFVTYTNSHGDHGRVTQTVTMNTACAVNGTLLTTQTAGAGRIGPFMPLQAGDTGVQYIESVRCTAGTDVGLFSLVLVKPIVCLTVRGIDAPTDVDFYTDQGGDVPRIVDDAYLNFITCPNGSLTGVPLNGDATFVWD